MPEQGHHEQRYRGGLRPLGQQVGLDQPGHVRVQGHPAFLVALAGHPHPAPADVDVGDPQAEYLRAAQPRQQHQPGHRMSGHDT